MKIEKLNQSFDYNDYTLYVSSYGNENNSGTKESPLTLLAAYDKTQELAKKNSRCVIKILDDITLKDTININGIYPVTFESESNQVIIKSSADYSILEEDDTKIVIETDTIPLSLIINNEPRYMTIDCPFDNPKNMYYLLDNHTYDIINTEDGKQFVSIPLSNINKEIPSIDKDTIVIWRLAWFASHSYNCTKNEDALVLDMKYFHKSYLINKTNVLSIKLNFLNIKDSQKSKYYYTHNKETNKYNIYYFKLDNETVTSIDIPLLPTLINCNNCMGVTFYNIKFIGNSIKNYSYSLSNSLNTEGAIKITNSVGINILKCFFTGTGNYSLYLSEVNYNINIIDNAFINLYGGGIHINGATGYLTISRTNNCLIRNNVIAHIGRYLTENAAILLITGNDIIIEYCEIFDTYAMGICSGRTWGYHTTVFEPKVCIKNCHIHHCMQMINSDGGAIYFLGPFRDTIVESNYIHDVYPNKGNTQKFEGARGIYFDEGARGITVRQNVIFSCLDLVITHYGTNNLVINNILAYGQRLFYSARTHNAIAFNAINNIILANKDLILVSEILPILIYGNIIEGNTFDTSQYHHDNFKCYISFKNEFLGNFKIDNILIENLQHEILNHIYISSNYQYPCDINYLFYYPHDSKNCIGVITSDLLTLCEDYMLGSDWDIEQRRKVKEIFNLDNEFLNYSNN